MPQAKLNPKYFFLSLGILVTLIASVTSFLNLVFETLNKKFPDVLNATYQYGYFTYDFEAMRSALATLIIVFPIFLLISYFWKHQEISGLGQIDAIIRKWLIYIILFLSAIVIVADLVTLVRYFVAGEITTRFILKVVTAFIVALVVGKYYIFELIDFKLLKVKRGAVFATISTIFVFAAIVWSFMVMGSPMKQRLLRLDDRRVSDLQNIQWQVINYWQQKEKLPASLNDLKDPLSGFTLPVDPEFEKGKVYEYKKLEKLKFELCATFALPMPKGWREWGGFGEPVPLMEPGFGIARDNVDTGVSYPYPVPDGAGDSWDHDAGRICFGRTIDPERYPPFSKQF